MPEGDTVLITARNLHTALAGRRVTGSDFRVPTLATADLTGATVVESTCRGKHLLLRFSNQLTLHSHLRMDGTWRTYPPRARWPVPIHLVRVVLRTDAVVAVGAHLHEVALIPTADEASLVGHLGPDLLGPDWDQDEAVLRLTAHPDTAVAEALLDQRSLAGIGNVYKSEVLYLRGISPWTPVRDVPDLPAVVHLAHRLLMANRTRFNRTTTGSLRRGDTTHVYGRRGAPCRRCGTPIRKAEQGERVTYWCPTCQPGSEPGKAGPPV